MDNFNQSHNQEEGEGFGSDNPTHLVKKQKKNSFTPVHGRNWPICAKVWLSHVIKLILELKKKYYFFNAIVVLTLSTIGEQRNVGVIFSR